MADTMEAAAGMSKMMQFMKLIGQLKVRLLQELKQHLRGFIPGQEWTTNTIIKLDVGLHALKLKFCEEKKSALDWIIYHYNSSFLHFTNAYY